MNNTREYFIQPDAIKDGSIELKKLIACKDISALGEYSTALGIGTAAKGQGSHAEGIGSIAKGQGSHAEGIGTITTNDAEHASGKYNVSNDGSTIFSVGIGASDTSRKNAVEIQYNDNGKTIINTPVIIDGDVNISGDLITNGTHIINNITEQNELEVTGETILKGTLDVSGITTLNNSLQAGFASRNVYVKHWRFSGPISTDIYNDNGYAYKVNDVLSDWTVFLDSVINNPTSQVYSDYIINKNDGLLAIGYDSENNYIIFNKPLYYKYTVGDGKMPVNIVDKFFYIGYFTKCDIKSEGINDKSSVALNASKAYGLLSSSKNYARSYAPASSAEGMGGFSKKCGKFYQCDLVNDENITNDKEAGYSGAYGIGSHVEGNLTISTISASYAHAEGHSTVVDNFAAHAEGRQTIASGYVSHAEGNSSIANGDYSHAEGYGTVEYHDTFKNSNKVNDSYYGKSDDEIKETWELNKNINIALGVASHVEGCNNLASGENSHVGGNISHASGKNSFAHGNSVNAKGENSVAIGNNTIANSDNSFVGGIDSNVSSENSFVFGNGCSIVNSPNSFVGGHGAKIEVDDPAKDHCNFVFGHGAVAWGTTTTHGNITLGTNSISYKQNSIAIGRGSTSYNDIKKYFPKDASVTASQRYKENRNFHYAGNTYSIAIGHNSYAAGNSSVTLGTGLLAQGQNSVAIGYNNDAIGNYSVTLGTGLLAQNQYEIALGRYNKSTSNTLFSIGNGTKNSKTGDISTSNIFEIQDGGIAYLNGEQIATQKWVKNEFVNSETIKSLETRINELISQLDAAKSRITALENDLAEISEEK